MKLFVTGRKGVIERLEKTLQQEKNWVWFHAASLGEYEQGLPIMIAFKDQFPEYKLLITFFSPSGYEIKKDTSVGVVTAYLPLDTANNANRFLDAVNPQMAFFIKYEFWPNYLKELGQREIPTYLIAGIINKRQLFFKWYGGWLKKRLATFHHFFLQDNASATALSSLGFSSYSVSGDTRFDRVATQLGMDNRISYIEEFLDGSPSIVFGSTWTEDESLLVPALNALGKEYPYKYIIAPHEIHKDQIDRLEQRLKLKSIRYSQREGKDLSSYAVFILDTVGVLSKVYSYASIAYVGGAVGTSGLHNILEPATFGVPIITGNQIDHFAEAVRLQQLAGLFTISDAAKLQELLEKMMTQHSFRDQTGMICGHYVNSNTGATQKIMHYLKERHTLVA